MKVLAWFLYAGGVRLTEGQLAAQTPTKATLGTSLFRTHDAEDERGSGASFVTVLSLNSVSHNMPIRKLYNPTLKSVGGYGWITVYGMEPHKITSGTAWVHQAWRCQVITQGITQRYGEDTYTI